MPAPVNTVIYPDLETVFNLVRIHLNDWQPGQQLMPGEGNISTDDPVRSPQVMTAFNSALRDLYRGLRLIGAPTLIRDNVLVNLPANGATGPSVQTNLSLQGYFDGLTLQSSPTLPNDLLFPLVLWEAPTGSGLPFVPMMQPEEGLPSGFVQGACLSVWEWRGGSSGYVPGVTGNDALWFVGSIVPTTIRIRYQSALTQFATLRFTVTALSVNGTTVTFTANQALIAGQSVRLGGFVNATYLNGLTVTVLGSGLSGTQFQATVANAPTGTDTGYGFPTTNYPLLYSSTFVPVADCEEALAWNTAYKIALAISGPNPGVKELQTNYVEAMRQLKNEYVRRAQTIEYNRQSYGADINSDSGYYGTSDNLL